MFFLIQYNRPSGKLISLRSFSDAEREVARDARLELELKLNREKVPDEVVLLQAESEAAIRQSHARYFDDLETLIHRLSQALSDRADSLWAP